MLRQGSHGTRVRIAQTRLNKHGTTPPVVVDGQYGPATTAAVKSFQAAHGLRPSGNISFITWVRLRRGCQPSAKPTPVPKPKPPSRPGVFVKMRGIDSSSPPDYKKLRSEGFAFACRYLSHNPEKNLTRPEAIRAAAAGIDRVVVWETTAGRSLDGYEAGKSDARDALKQATTCGMPPGRPIYFAVDFDTNGAPSRVDAYFEGAASILGVAATGAYGGIEVVEHLFDASRIRYAWQTYAWSNGKWFARAQLRQTKNGVTAGGVSADLDESAHTDYGQW